MSRYLVDTSALVKYYHPEVGSSQIEDGNLPDTLKPARGSQRRGATNPKVLYHGADVFTSLWSGDTRIMIQLMQELLDEANAPPALGTAGFIEPERQDRVFRNSGGQWLESQTRNQPTNIEAVERELMALLASLLHPSSFQAR